MKTCAFVRALWGDERNPMLAKVYADVTRSLESYNHPTPILDFAYGEHNAAFLRKQCIEPRLLSLDVAALPAPVADFAWRKIDPKILQAESIYGTRFWILKLNAMLEALSLVEQVVWLDWDIRILRPLPDDFWHKREAGPTFQGSLRELKRDHCPWRKAGRGQTPHGGVVYCRDSAVLRKLIVLQRMLPLASDEELFGIHVEMEWGDWGPDAPDRWKREGYELNCYRHRSQKWKPQLPVFWHGPRIV